MVIRLVSEHSDFEIRRRRDAENLKRNLRELTANLLRICRGGGKEVVPEQMARCLEAFNNYHASHGHYPSKDILREILDPETAFLEHRPWVAERTPADIQRWTEDGTLAREAALQDIRSGALQMTASMLLNQLAHQSRGQDEIYGGISVIEAERERNRSRSRAPATPSKRSGARAAAATKPRTPDNR